MNSIELSVIMPAFNEGAKLKDNIEETLACLEKLGLRFEIIVVDDGSDDGSWDILKEVASHDARVSAVRHEENWGKGQSLKKGFASATGERVAFLDADLDVSPGQLKGLLQRMDETRADIVISSKRHPRSVLHYPVYRRVMSTVYFMWVKALFGLPIRDTQTGLKLFKRRVLEEVFPKVLIKQFAYDLEILVIAHHLGFSIQEAPVKLDFRRRFGRIGMRTVMDIAWDTLAIFYRLRMLHYYDYKEWAPWSVDKAPMVSVLIAVRSWDGYLQECLIHCARLEYPRFEVIVLPDEPMEKEASFAYDERIRFIPTGPVAPGKKRDIGARSARGEVLAFLDSDAYPAPDWLTMATRHFQNPLVAAVGGPGVTPPEDRFLQKAGGLVYESWFGSGPARIRYTPHVLREVDDYPSCNLLVRRKDFEAVQGFQTGFWPGEDTILCRNLVYRISKKIIYDPRTVVFHHRRSLFGPHLIQVKNYAFHRGYFAKRFPENSRRWVYFIPLIFCAFMVSALSVSLFFPRAITFFLVPAAAYLALIFAGSLPARRLPLIFAVWLGIFLTHLAYGAFFFKGLLSQRGGKA